MHVLPANQHVANNWIDVEVACPVLEIGEHLMNPEQYDVRGHGTDGAGIVAVAENGGTANSAARLGGVGNGDGVADRAVEVVAAVRRDLARRKWRARCHR